MSFICFIACMDTSDHRLSHLFKDPMTVADDFADIYDALVKRPLHLQFWLHKLGLLCVPTNKTLTDLGQPYSTQDFACPINEKL